MLDRQPVPFSGPPGFPVKPEKYGMVLARQNQVSVEFDQYTQYGLSLSSCEIRPVQSQLRFCRVGASILSGDSSHLSREACRARCRVVMALDLVLIPRKPCAKRLTPRRRIRCSWEKLLLLWPRAQPARTRQPAWYRGLQRAAGQVHHREGLDAEAVARRAGNSQRGRDAEAG